MRAVQSKILLENLFIGRKLRGVSLAVKPGHEVLPVSGRAVETSKKMLAKYFRTLD
jgi:hypothetical protein